LLNFVSLITCLTTICSILSSLHAYIKYVILFRLLFYLFNYGHLARIIGYRIFINLLISLFFNWLYIYAWYSTLISCHSLLLTLIYIQLQCNRSHLELNICLQTGCHLTFFLSIILLNCCMVFLNNSQNSINIVLYHSSTE
jgi:hypothetical protein